MENVPFYTSWDVEHFTEMTCCIKEQQEKHLQAALWGSEGNGTHNACLKNETKQQNKVKMNLN